MMGMAAAVLLSSFVKDTLYDLSLIHISLSASLNKFGTVNLGYMREITDTTEEELLGVLKGRIFYNPVSYTHLDVYKRQVPCQGGMPSVSPRCCPAASVCG